MGRVTLPIFPLPDLTFFPHTLLPLHVFEARYRAMVTDCLGRDRRLAVVGLRPGYEEDYEGRPAVHRVAGAGEIVHCERLATGRFNIVLRGEQRVRIDRELPADTLYRLVEGTVLEDVGGERPAAAALADQVRDLCRRLLKAAGKAGHELDGVLGADQPPGVLADRVAGALAGGPRLRQALLEEPDVERRLARLSEALRQLARKMERGA